MKTMCARRDNTLLFFPTVLFWNQDEKGERLYSLIHEALRTVVYRVCPDENLVRSWNKHTCRWYRWYQRTSSHSSHIDNNNNSNLCLTPQLLSMDLHLTVKSWVQRPIPEFFPNLSDCHGFTPFHSGRG